LGRTETSDIETLGLGAGRSQVQILSPRLQEIPAIWPVSARPGGARRTRRRVQFLEFVDEEVRRIIAACSEHARQMLSEHREQLDQLAQALLARETLDEADAYAAAEIPRPSTTPRSRCPSGSWLGVSGELVLEIIEFE
jgi:hypothetical protein